MSLYGLVAWEDPEVNDLQEMLYGDVPPAI